MKMACPILPLLVFVLAAATAAARPCKTLFFYSATTTADYPFNSHHRNPNSDPLLQRQNPRYLTLIFTATSRFSIRRPRPEFGAVETLNGDTRPSQLVDMPSHLPIRVYSAVAGSIRDRSRDILLAISALAALLLGAGCGALTAAATYSVYVLFSRRRRRRVDSGEADLISSDDGASDDLSFFKEFGYVAVADAPKLADDTLGKPAK
ncbi:hypothetical protein STAS_23003 [Striga asiatica]|uniref:Uncharacterized protein n=1 Tax=Striga asiatica TaxID=4170 RepID=A0A5A7QNI6_STRAF|nr:hypothetical protein STAS_23003 [Striga asiatica]